MGNDDAAAPRVAAIEVRERESGGQSPLRVFLPLFQILLKKSRPFEDFFGIFWFWGAVLWVEFFGEVIGGDGDGQAECQF